MFLRTMGDATIGLALFLAFTVAIGDYQRVSDATNRMGDILSANSSAGGFLKFSLDDSPLIAAAVAVTAVPVQHTGAVNGLRQTDRNKAFLLLAGICSVLMALNLAFIRHLCREYASPRRGAWGGARFC
ncbi:MAG: hypothetical protein ACR2OF_07080 [Hyphomicrobium sp.]